MTNDMLLSLSSELYAFYIIILFACESVSLLLIQELAEWSCPNFSDSSKVPRDGLKHNKFWGYKQENSYCLLLSGPVHTRCTNKHNKITQRCYHLRLACRQAGIGQTCELYQMNPAPVTHAFSFGNSQELNVLD